MAKRETVTTSTNHCLRPVPVTLDDVDLVLSAKDGDSGSFETLFRRYRPRLFAIARRYFAPGSDRDDLLQEATIGFYKAIRDFITDRGPFISFADLCVRRQVITFIKQATRQKHSFLNRAISLDAPVFEDSEETLIGRLAVPDSNFALAESEPADFLRELNMRCSSFERLVLSLYNTGLGYQEMGWELGVDRKSIDNTLWRIKVKARKLLAQKPWRDLEVAQDFEESKRCARTQRG